MEKEFWGRRVETKVHAAEKQLDLTVRAMMDLVAEIQDGQADLNVSPVSTNATLAKVMEAMAHLQEARSDVTSAHRRVEQLGKDLGIRPTAIGPVKLSPDTEMVESADIRAAL